jgi:DtxR family manganese transport transcriptional regulator
LTPTGTPLGGEAAEEDPRAASFQRAREAHHTEIAEDYVELIAELIDQTGEARGVDIARRLGVAQATVVQNIARLQREGLVASRPYRAVFLTEKGHELARWSRRRHRVVLAFLRALGVSDATAAADAEGIEHHVSEETLDALERLTERLADDRGR